ncbi:helix-turn-helix domain-containing protein [Natrinema gelatinilyticum]|nr:helix-turn-helix domain-containing protein [Natrinema gelatinilyticum]
MEYSPRYRLFPTTTQRESLDWTRDTVRQLYNHALHEILEVSDESDAGPK